MKASSIILLIIGILGLIASGINWYSGDSFYDILITVISSVCLVWGAFEIRRVGKKD